MNQQVTSADHAEFLRILPRIEKIAHCQFQHLHGDNHDEMVQSVLTIAWVLFARLIKQGRGTAVNWKILGNFAVRRVRQGRHIGSRLNCFDALSEYTRGHERPTAKRLDRFDRQQGTWREVLVEDHHATPAELAASRIDFSAWLRTLSARHRQIVDALVSGEPARSIAGSLGVSEGRVSQIRAELKQAWQVFQGEVEPKTALAAA